MDLRVYYYVDDIEFDFEKIFLSLGQFFMIDFLEVIVIIIFSDYFEDFFFIDDFDNLIDVFDFYKIDLDDLGVF